MENSNLKLFLVSCLVLFLEISLVRWISTEIRIFAYLSNLVLLACFLGIGLGCYLSKKKTNILITATGLFLLSLVVHARIFQEITDMLSGFSDYLIWKESLQPHNFIPGIIGTSLTLIIFAILIATFFPLGQLLGKLLDDHPKTIIAYSVNIVGSLTGVWIFHLFSLLGTPPGVWLALTLLFLFPLMSRRDLFLYSLIVLLIFVVNGMPKNSSTIIWSPYQKLEILPNFFKNIQNGYAITVNGVGYMSAIDMSDHFIQSHENEFGNISQREYSQYQLPFWFAEHKNKVLIVGAGAGNDVAGALHSGVEEIDAIEIDPTIYFLGKLLHPEHPYQEKNVDVFINDARAFLKNPKTQYDVISFGLLDAHTLSSNYNNIRLDHYLYTKESFRDVKRSLKKDGIVSVIFASRRDWITQRIYGLLRDVFGEVPYIFEVSSPEGCYGLGGTMFLTGNNLDKIKSQVNSDEKLKRYLKDHQVDVSGKIKLTTDDWPYLYVQRPIIPRIHLFIIFSLLICILIGWNYLKRNGSCGKLDLHFFFLGAAFLLLEFQSINKSALLFGSTWVTNSYTISAILFLILLANLYAYFIKIKNIQPFYYLIIVSLLILYALPIDLFNIWDGWIKPTIGILVLNLPVFFAGVIFIDSFQKTGSKNTALGSNLFGAVVGGILQTVSFITGIKALLLIVLFCYLLAYVFRAQNAKQNISPLI